MPLGILADKALRDRKIPFEIAAPVNDFYSESNIAQIKKADEQVRSGKVIVKTMDEPEAMTNDDRLRRTTELLR